ncbi:hypothetical protein [Flavobacterium caeni]|uniref:CarboxypepD_reg-like domain-containing protein n=1 Tax=Flavobacterium caeni TaxID=490189 RepID=A0A1G5I5T4_9FLAO|nr:hypothetical protein [Flavobacterium caeni]SCY71456.1 hypothetical protein SAMN02927903_02120 [Flavobacterium caeni]
MSTKKNNILLIALLLVAQWAFSQTAEPTFYGKIVVDSASVENINVLNSRTQKATVTNAKGEFSMGVKIGDLLILSSFNLETKRKFVRAEDLRGELILLKMTLLANELDEVKVQQSEITAESLRIPTATKHYTPAERKVRTATTGLLDPLFNKLSGRTRMLKKQVLVEKNEKLLLKLDGLYEDKYYTDVLKIPNDYIGGFQYYIVEDPDFARALVDKNKTLTMFYIKKLAVDYVDLIKQEEAEAAKSTETQK